MHSNSLGITMNKFMINGLKIKVIKLPDWIDQWFNSIWNIILKIAIWISDKFVDKIKM